MTVLIIRFSSLGDIVLSTSVVEALNQKYPDASIHFLTKDVYAHLFNGDPRLERIVGISKGDTISGIRKKVSDVNYDLVIDLHASLRSRLVVAKLDADSKIRIRKHSLERRLMVASRGIYKKKQDVLGSMLATVRSLGIESRIYPRLFPEKSAEITLQSKLPNAGENLIGIAPGSLHDTKRWNEDSFASLADKLCENGFHPVFIGDSGDIQVIDKIRAKMQKESLSLAGSLSLSETVALIAGLRGIVTNDSGPMHIAGAVGTPFAAIFGPTHPSLGFDPEYPNGTVLHSGAKCSPCSIHGEKKCRMKSRFCMDDISWNDVFESLIKLT